MFSLKKLISLTLLSSAFAAPSASPDGLDFTGVNAEDSIVTVVQRGFFFGNQQCGGTDAAIQSIQNSVNAIVQDISTAADMVSASQKSKTPFAAELIAQFTKISASSANIATQLLAVKWSCVTFFTVPAVISSMINLLSNMSRLFLNILTYAITTKIAIDQSVWNEILSIPTKLISALEQASKSAGILGLMLSGFISQIKNVIASLTPHCQGCTNPFN